MRMRNGDRLTKRCFLCLKVCSMSPWKKVVLSLESQLIVDAFVIQASWQLQAIRALVNQMKGSTVYH